jgi:hypothetical protein
VFDQVPQEKFAEIVDETMMEQNAQRNHQPLVQQNGAPGIDNQVAEPHFVARIKIAQALLDLNESGIVEVDGQGLQIVSPQAPEQNEAESAKKNEFSQAPGLIDESDLQISYCTGADMCNDSMNGSNGNVSATPIDVDDAEFLGIMFIFQYYYDHCVCNIILFFKISASLAGTSSSDVVTEKKQSKRRMKIEQSMKKKSGQSYSTR